MNEERFAALESRIEAMQGEDFTPEEMTEVRTLLKATRRALMFFNGLGWIGGQMKALAGWAAAMFGAYVLFKDFMKW